MSRYLHYLFMIMIAVGISLISSSCSGGGGGGSSSTSTPSTFTPPDPASVATQIAPTKPTTLAESTAFLYSGESAVQRGITPNIIEVNKAAVIRGKVLDKLNAPLSGVRITILNHPEYGYTYSRDDGMFDMSVNGGEDLAVNYTKEGYMKLQRTSSVQKQDFTLIDDVVMRKYSEKTSLIDFDQQTKPFSVMQGETIADARGTRTDTVLFPKNTSAQMVFSDGSTRSLKRAHVRATEYTTDENGLNAMPAMLPKGVAYTYCVELSVDEAESAGATGVTFSKPVINYVENFQKFPVGDIVPTYYYDKENGKWIRTDDGKVIAIVSITDELADIDIDGDGIADDVSALGMNDDERRNIATLYTAGTELWRTPVSHFSPIDHNWPEPSPPDDATDNEPDGNSLTQEDPEEPCQATGSIIECQEQALGERISLVGTPLTLNYRSKRTEGDLRNEILNIQLTQDSWLVSLQEIQLELVIAGKKIKTSFEEFTSNMKYQYIWDGKDAYGRDVFGPQSISVKISYIYHYNPDDLSDYNVVTGGGSSSDTFVVGGEPSVVRIGPEYARNIHRWNSSLIKHIVTPLGIDGWSISSHNQLNIWDKELVLGNGEVEKIASLYSNLPFGFIITIAGTGNYGYSGDGGSALNASFNARDVAVGGDGSIYLADTWNHVVRKIDVNGTINTIAGTGNKNWHYGYVSKQPALNADLGLIEGIDIALDGSLYITNTIDDTSSGGIRYSTILKITPDGNISTVAGNNVSYNYGNTNNCDDYPVKDGEDATAGCIGLITGLAVDNDGEFYISVGNHDKIRKVDISGIITTVAGTGESGYSGDGGAATEALLGYPRGIDVGRDGSLYFSSGAVIRKIAPDGIITRVAGTGNYGYSGDGGSALLADLDIYNHITVDADDNIYLPDSHSVVRRINAEGIIDTIAGKAEAYEYAGDGGDVKDATFVNPYAISIDKENNLYILSGSRLRKVKREESIKDQDLGIVSKDLKEVYYFDNDLKHLNTKDTFSGQIKSEFIYDSAGYLTQIKDSYGLATTIEYDANSRASAVVAPYGQRTQLAYDENGYLSSITNPAGEAWGFRYTEKGLLTAITKPNGHTSSYEYDEVGALKKATDAAGGTQMIERKDIDNGYEVSRTTKLGRTTKYRVENLEGGLQHLLNTMPGGLVFESNITKGTVSSIVTTYPDGSVISATRGSDPRFGIAVSPFTKIQTLTMPSGLTYTINFNKEVTLSDSDNPLSLLTQTDKVTLNNSVFTKKYNSTTNTKTLISPEGRTAVVTFNAKGDVIKRVFGNLTAVEYAYNEKGKLTQITQGNRSVSFTYNSKGYLSSMTDPLNKTTSFTYDDAGRVIKQTFADLREISYSYDAMGNLLSLTPPQKPKHDFSYTSVDKVEKYTPPSVAETGSTEFSYNLDKQLTKITRPDGKRVEFSYDSAGRLSAVEDISYGYDTTTGNIKTITDADNETLTFDFDGSLLREIALSGTVAGTFSQTFNNDFRVSAQSINGANSIEYTYDKDGLSIKVGAMDIVRDTVNGYIKQTVLNAVKESRTFNSLGQMQSCSVEDNSSTAIFTVNYTYDKLNRITQLEEKIDEETHTYSYSYDDAGRLSGVSKEGVNIGTYTYDANGNRLSANGVNTSYDDQDRLQTLGSLSYSYTANGELLSREEGTQTTSYTYDLLGNLKSVVLPDNREIDYLVDGLNRRVGKKVNGTLVQGFLYQDTLNPVAELDTNNNIVSRFVYASKSNVPDYMIKNGVTYRIISDHLGTPRIILNAADGSVVQRMDYDVWGNVINDTNPGFQPFGFAGGLYDRDTKLTHFGSRDYDAQSGRWTAKDPVSFEGRDSNLYAYVLNNPINLMDPTGLFSIGSVIGSLIDAYETASGIVDSTVSALENAITLNDILNSHPSNDPSTLLDLIDHFIDAVGDLLPVDTISEPVHAICGEVRDLTGPNGAITRHNNRLQEAYNAGP